MQVQKHFRRLEGQIAAGHRIVYPGQENEKEKRGETPEASGKEQGDSGAEGDDVQTNAEATDNGSKLRSKPSTTPLSSPRHTQSPLKTATFGKGAKGKGPQQQQQQQPKQKQKIANKSGASPPISAQKAASSSPSEITASAAAAAADEAAELEREDHSEVLEPPPGCIARPHPRRLSASSSESESGVQN